MELTAQQIETIQAQITGYEQKRDQALAEANLAQGAVIALRQLLPTQAPAEPAQS